MGFRVLPDSINYLQGRGGGAALAADNCLGCRWLDDPLYFIDPNPIKLGDLGLRHPVIRQGANATELRSRNM
jgi:hypothetical protein